MNERQDPRPEPCRDLLRTSGYRALTYLIDVLCNNLHIIHKTIRPATPWHNGKVERSHRNDQEWFYNHLSFYSYEDLQIQMKRYLYRSNRIPMSVLGWKSPIQKRQGLEAARFC